MTQCPVCGAVLPAHCMKCNGKENGENFERWVCELCGKEFFVVWD